MSKNQDLIAKKKLAEMRSRMEEKKLKLSEKSELKAIDPEALVTEDMIISYLHHLKEFNTEDIEPKAGMDEEELFYCINSMLLEAGLGMEKFLDTGCGYKKITSAVNALVLAKQGDNNGQQLQDGKQRIIK